MLDSDQNGVDRGSEGDSSPGRFPLRLSGARARCRSASATGSDAAGVTSDSESESAQHMAPDGLAAGALPSRGP